MNFKKPKEEVINEAWMAAEGVLQEAFNGLKHGVMYSNTNSNIDSIKFGISEGIRRAIESLVENTYTDQEFEEDLQLRDKS